MKKSLLLPFCLVVISGLFCVHSEHSLHEVGNEQIEFVRGNVTEGPAQPGAALWKVRFEKFLDDVQENSMMKGQWNSQKWEQYRQKQLEYLPICSEKQFNDGVSHALADLGDNHSYLIIKPENGFSADNKSAREPSVTVEEGIGIIVIPTLSITEVDQEDELLHTTWVSTIQHKIHCAREAVTKGWIIDLTQNSGGVMTAMIAALSGFLHNPEIGGFYFPEEGLYEHIAFDGKSFLADGEPYLTYKITFPLSQNTLPLAVLIGPNTASSAEFLALALKRQPDTTLIGQESSGIATVNAAMELPDKLGYYMLTIGYYLDEHDRPLFSMRVEPTILVAGDAARLMEEAKNVILLDQSFLSLPSGR